MKWVKRLLIGILVAVIVVTVHLALPAVLCARNYAVCMATQERVRNLPPSHIPIPVYPFRWHP